MDKCYGIIYQQYECNNPSCESVKEKHAKTPAKLAQLTAMDESGDLKKICMSEENPTKLRGLGVSFASIDPRLIGDDGLLPDELRVRYHVKLYYLPWARRGAARRAARAPRALRAPRRERTVTGGAARRGG